MTCSHVGLPKASSRTRLSHVTEIPPLLGSWLVHPRTMPSESQNFPEFPEFRADDPQDFAASSGFSQNFPSIFRESRTTPRCKTIYVYNSHIESIEFLGKLRMEHSLYTNWAAKQCGGKRGRSHDSWDMEACDPAVMTQMKWPEPLSRGSILGIRIKIYF